MNTTNDDARPAPHLTTGAVPVALVVAALALLAAAPTPAASLYTLRGLPSVLDPLDPAAPVLAVLGLTAWALTSYLALVVGLVLLGRTPGLVGRLAAALARRTVPVSVRRAVEAVLGAGLVLGTLGTGPASASASTSADTAQVMPTTATAATASLDWPVSTSERSAAPAAPDAAPGTPPTALPVTTHVVRPGDTLWHLAAQALRTPGGPAPADVAVAAAWPSWWEANREAIGDNPHLLHPGTSLVAPPPAP